MNKIAVLITVHNRKEKTDKCLQNLFAQKAIGENYNIDVYITDDGCSDGTPEMIREKYPSVSIVRGDGTLFWNRGMYVAWEVASKAQKYDYFLWLNDDSYLNDDCIDNMLTDSAEMSDESIIVASMSDHSRSFMTYGGYRVSDGKLATPNGELQECSTMNGNCVLIPEAVFKICGNLDWTYRHAIGDLDYGYSARRKGVKIYASKYYLGTCDKNPKLPAWTRTDVPLSKRIKNLYSPLGYAEPGPYFHYDFKNFGLLQAIKHYLTIHLRVLFPQLWNK